MSQGETLTLIKTKLDKPWIGDDFVSRPHLIERLDRGLNRKLTLLSAPAGYGKTTTAALWVQNCNRPSAWLSLDENDNDLVSFLSYIVAAFRTIYTNALQETDRLLRAPQLPSMDYLVTSCINSIAALPQPGILVLDDYHFIRDRTIQEFMDRLVTHMPRQLHLVLCCRIDPNMPLSLLRARRQLNELRYDELRFSLSEIRQFLEQQVGRPVDPKGISLLEQRTEGWVTALQLAAISMRNQRDYHSFIEGFSGHTDLLLVDYLVDEVFDRQSQARKQFLLRTSLPDRICASLCDALLEGENQVVEPSQDMLHQLERSGFFIRPLDDEHGWYRYHQLIRDLLRQRLREHVSEDELAAMHLRISAWFSANGHVQEALRQALVGGHVTEASRLVEEHRISLINGEAWNTLDSWLSLLPEGIASTRPALLITRAMIFSYKYNLFASLPLLEEAQKCLDDDDILLDEERIVLQAEIDAYLSQAHFLSGDDYEHCLAVAERALRNLPLAHSRTRGLALGFRCFALQAMGQTERAENLLTAAAYDSTEPPSFRLQVHIALCFVYLASAKLYQVWQVSKHFHDLGIEHNHSAAIAWSNLFSGFVHYEWGELEAAANHFSAAYNLHREIDFGTVYQSIVGLIKTYQGLGKLEQAQLMIDELRGFSVQVGNAGPLLEMELLQSRNFFLQGDAPSARRWARSVQTSVAQSGLILYEDANLMRSLIWLTQALEKDWTLTIEQLQNQLAYAEQRSAPLRSIQILAQLAIVCQKQSKEKDAHDYLQRAIILAEPGGFVHTFVDLGPEMAELLNQTIAQADFAEATLAYANQVLEAFPATTPEVDPIQAALLRAQSIMSEPLTPREVEVLFLLNEGWKPREIAEELFISLHTVKKHTSNAYSKLDVGSREEAIAKSFALGLFSPE